jgi:hypothetical protein
MTASNDEGLWKSVFRRTGRDPLWVGFWLRLHRLHERIGPARLAARLGLDQHGLVLLSLCRAPREDHFRADLEVLCQRTGADEITLARILRQEQARALGRGRAASWGLVAGRLGRGRRTAGGRRNTARAATRAFRCPRN